jgi:hypothetical protein
VHTVCCILAILVQAIAPSVRLLLPRETVKITSDGKSSEIMALFQCVLAALVAAGVAVQPEAPVRRHREQVAGDCTDHSAFDGGGASWQGRCKTLDQCRDSCAQSNNCVAFNWWSKRGGCRHYSNTGYTKRTTAHTTIGGAPACHYDKAGPTDCDTCSNCQQETEEPAPEYPEDCDDTKYFMGTPYHQTEIRGTSDFADMVKKCKSQYMDAGGFGGWSQRYSNGNGWCARFTREPTQQEWDSAGKSACAAYPGASGHCGAVCGTKFNDGVAPSCFGQSRFDNFDWANNNTCDKQPCTVYKTSDPYHAYCLKMACANTQRDAWCAAGGNSACRNQCGKCSDSQKACLQ